jgi:hypothetical protein
LFWRVRANLRRLEHSYWIFVVGGVVGILFWDSLLLLLNLSIALWGGGGDITIRTQYGDLKAWWLIYLIMTAVGFSSGALYASGSYEPKYKPPLETLTSKTQGPNDSEPLAR